MWPSRPSPAQTHERFPMRILAYGIMPNDRHMVLWPRENGELTIN